MFDGKREFRSIIVQTSSSSAKEFLKCLGRAVDKKLKLVEQVDQSFAVFHGFFYSKTPFQDSDKLDAIKVTRNGSDCFKYDFYLVSRRQKKSTSFIVFVPFSKMASEMFGAVNEKISKRKYGVVNLESLLENLKSQSDFSSSFSPTMIKFLVSGNDSVNSTVLTGRNVIDSEYFKRTSKHLNGIELVPKRVRLSFKEDGASLSFSMDQYGNFWLRVKQGGVNLPLLSRVFDEFEKKSLLGSTIRYPLASSVSETENE